MSRPNPVTAEDAAGLRTLTTADPALTPYTDPLVAIAENGVALLPPDGGRRPLAFTRFGGAPGVPADFTWPTTDGTPDGPPYAFVAQVDLSEVTAFDVNGLLPTRGLLYFFLDTAAPIGPAPGRVVHLPDARPADTAPATGGPAAFPGPIRVAADRHPALPSYPGRRLAELGAAPPDDGHDHFLILEHTPFGPVRGEPPHLLGPDRDTDHDLRLTAARYALGDTGWRDPAAPLPDALRRERDDWRMLLEPPALPATGSPFHFLIRDSALAEGDFDDVLVITTRW